MLNNAIFKENKDARMAASGQRIQEEKKAVTLFNTELAA